jgi:hypothetical protein
MNRRLLLLLSCAGVALGADCRAGAAIEIVREQRSAMTGFGAAELTRALEQAGCRVAASPERIRLAITPALGAEAFRIRPSGAGLVVEGGDERGVMYGALDLAEQISIHRGVPGVTDKQRRPHVRVRALKFNIPLPGAGYVSEEDLANNAWFWDFDFWTKFLDMAARNRYNTLTFWSAHPFDRMVRIPKYPEATALSQPELDKNIAFFRKLFQMAADRGLNTYLVTWNIHVPRCFAEKHGIPASGQDSPLVRDYMREAIRALMETYPMLTGLSTTPGERMAGMSVPQVMDWIADTYFRALRAIPRNVPFILRSWYAEPEALNRMLEREKYPGEILLDLKFNGEHMYSSPRPHVQDRRWQESSGKNYRILWHLRNDCMFLLRWGHPAFARETLKNVALNGAAGFLEGSELDVPGYDRTVQPQAPRSWTYKFEKHWFRYMLWGRLGYWPDEPDTLWRELFVSRFGEAGGPLFDALNASSAAVPLVTSFHWNYMNGDWYPEGSIGSWNTSQELPRANYRRATMYHDALAWMFNSTIDETLTGVVEYVLAGAKPGSQTPEQVASRLEAGAQSALHFLTQVRSQSARDRAELSSTVQEIEASARLGRYYAAKIGGVVALARLLLLGEEAARPVAVKRFEEASAQWREIVEITSRLFVPREIWLFGPFDWKRYTSEVERDVQLAKTLRPLPVEEMDWNGAQGRTRARLLPVFAQQGMHEWLKYAATLDGRARVRVAALGGTAASAELAVPHGRKVSMEISGDPVEALWNGVPMAAASAGRYEALSKGTNRIALRFAPGTESFTFRYHTAPEVVVVRDALSPDDLTPPMRAAQNWIELGEIENGPGNSITGERDSIRQHRSATYRIVIPEAGEYELWALAWWPGPGPGFGLMVDEMNMHWPVLRPSATVKLREWVATKGEPLLALGSGAHTVRFFGRQPGARVRRFVLVPKGTSPAKIEEALLLHKASQ